MSTQIATSQSQNSTMSTEISQTSFSILSTKIPVDKVLNPETKRYIKINGKIFNTLVETKFTYDSENKILSPSPDYINVSTAVSVVNPLTNRKIKIGGKIYEELLKSCIYDAETNVLKLIDGESVKKTDDKIINPLTNRKITIGGKIFETLLLTHAFNSSDKNFSKIEVVLDEKIGEHEVSVSDTSVPEEL
jgi:hypothetical protein